MKRIATITVCLLLGFPVLVQAQAKLEVQDPTCYPMLMDCNPLAAQVGRSSTHVVDARYDMAGAFEVLVNARGVTGEVLPEKDAKPSVTKSPLTKLNVKFTVDPSALAGVYDFRIATPHGASTLGQLVVVRDPVVVEQGANDTLAKAQAVEWPAAVCGAVEALEDVDYYKFKVSRGASLVFHVRAARCQDKLHDMKRHVDPIITLRNAQGSVLAMSDNYFFADPLLKHTFADEGEYYLEIRDVRYQGDAYWQYVVEINDRPFVTNVFPMAIAPGETTPLELIGFNLPSNPTVLLNVSHDAADGPRWQVPLLEGKPTNPVPVVVSRLPLASAANNNHVLAQAQQIAIPAGINGRIASAGQSDYYALDAKKGDRFSIEVMARRHQSALDPIVTIFNEKGARLLESDDFTRHRMLYSDCLIENWIARANGRYTIELRDLQRRGGPAFVYYLSVTRSKPDFWLEIDGDKAVLAPGGAAALFVRAMARNGFAGEIQLAVEGLPRGIKASGGRILAGEKDGCIVFAADKNAKLQAVNVRVIGTATSAENAAPVLSAVALPWQEVNVPGGSRLLYPVEMCTVSVGEQFDIRAVRIKPAKITLEPGGSQKIEVAIERAAGFNKNVSLDCMCRHLGTIYGNSLPQGVTIDEKHSKLLLAGGQTTGYITLVAAKDAKPAARQLVPVQAHVSINFVIKMSYASEPLFVTVAPPSIADKSVAK